mmetsp:Transcript_24517/g.56573  ORF Transcript_24517/g.56573 Transcript_24517/m.56573 type:complete len:272 (+) Transcript_24517:1374-2189(+)
MPSLMPTLTPMPTHPATMASGTILSHRGNQGTHPARCVAARACGGRVGRSTASGYAGARPARWMGAWTITKASIRCRTRTRTEMGTGTGTGTRGGHHSAGLTAGTGPIARAGPTAPAPATEAPAVPAPAHQRRWPMPHVPTGVGTWGGPVEGRRLDSTSSRVGAQAPGPAWSVVVRRSGRRARRRDALPPAHALCTAIGYAFAARASTAASSRLRSVGSPRVAVDSRPKRTNAEVWAEGVGRGNRSFEGGGAKRARPATNTKTDGEGGELC